MADRTYNDALASAGATAAMFLEIKDPVDLAIVERCLPPAVIALALGMVESDATFKAQWDAADGWFERGLVLHETILWLLRPEAQAVTA